ncbi:MAG: glycosyl transferase family 1 [Gemmatimonadaceae bacterium]
MQTKSVKPRIVILSGIQLSGNPRVVKEADALAEAGYEVEVVCAAPQRELQERDRQLREGKGWKQILLLDAGSSKWNDRAFSLFARVRFRFWGEVFARIGISNPRQAGLVVPEMLRHCIRHPADLYIVHNPDSLWVGTELLRRGRAIGVDIEDWYSEDLLPADRRTYPADDLRRWEGIVLRGASYATTTSRSLSCALASAYHCALPAVVYNSFSWDDRDGIDGRIRDRVDLDIPSLFWFSQVIGSGRGLETLMDALHHTRTEFEIHLRGTSRPEYREFLLGRAPVQWRKRIHFHDQVSQGELLSRTAEHDIGLAAEIPFCRSRALTVTNKLPLYILAGLAVLASDTDGQKEIAALSPDAVNTFRAADARSLAEAIDRLTSDRAKIRSAKEHALALAKRSLSWEQSRPVLLDQVAHALAGRPHTLREVKNGAR